MFALVRALLCVLAMSSQEASQPKGVAGDMPGGLPNERQVSVPTHPCGGSADGSVRPTVRIARIVMRTFLTKQTQPNYPEVARKQHIEGTVLLQVRISREGTVCDAALISGHPLLAPAAIEAVKQWRYKPYLLNGQAVEVETQALINFALK